MVQYLSVQQFKDNLEVFEIKRLDNRYWANFTDSLIYGKNMKTAKDFDKYQVLLTRYEHSAFLTEHFKEEISRMFKWSFV